MSFSVVCRAQEHCTDYELVGFVQLTVYIDADNISGWFSVGLQVLLVTYIIGHYSLMRKFSYQSLFFGKTKT